MVSVLPARSEPLISLSTSSVYPESTLRAFDIAQELGFDAVEVMVGLDKASTDIASLDRLRTYYEVPIGSIHAPCLLVTQRTWGSDPWDKLYRSAEAALHLDAQVVVVHPPFRWQRSYAAGFTSGIRQLTHTTGITFAVENMYPWRARSREVAAYSPGWDIRLADYPHTTLDLSHTAVSQSDPLRMADDLGERLAHIHLADGSGSARDEHLIPGRGNQPAGPLLELLARRGFDGTVVVEVSTRKAASRAEREADLAEALAFARLHMAVSPTERRRGRVVPDSSLQ